MKIKLKFNAQFVGSFSKIVTIEDGVIMNEDDIKLLFKPIMGVDYDDNCSYEILENVLCE